ncbi:MAG: hypothetical protein U0572_00935 [Phycisphaerales bacterium]
MIAATCLVVAALGIDFAHSDDWVTAGYDCTLFAAGDIDGDGFGDVVTLNGEHKLCVAYSVGEAKQLWKASGWEVLRENLRDRATALVVADVVAEWPGREVIVAYGDDAVVFGSLDHGRFTQERPASDAVKSTLRGALSATIADGVVEPPPYEPSAPPLLRFRADIDGDGRDDALTVFSATIPHAHRVVRLAVALHEGTGDSDGDGVNDERERELGSDPHDRDTDDDGLLDGWEVNGLPRGVGAGDGTLNPARQDVIVAVSRYEELDEATAHREVDKAKRLYAAMPTKNPDGSTGITLHARWGTPVPKSGQGSWWDVGGRELPASNRGIAHWMQITPGGGGQAQQTGDMGGSGAHWAAFGHELAHQLSLSHEGDSSPAWCPLYPSLMNYAFNYSLGGDGEAIRFSDGRFRSVELREESLLEKLPFPYDEVKYLAAPPFRFTLKDNGDGTTLIDWNHDGHFDDQPVAADINYGGSTYCGTRRNVEIASAAPALCVVGGVTYLSTVDPKCTAVSIRACEGDGQWAAPRAVPSSATRFDPVLVGLGDEGFVFFRTQRAWCVARFTRDAIDAPVELPELSTCDISACAFGGRVLIVTRDDADALRTCWFRWAPPNGEARLTPPQPLDLSSHVPPGLAQIPGEARVLIATSAKNPAGHDWCLRASWCSISSSAAGDALHVDESRWTRGEKSVNHCTTRPVVAYRALPDGHELNILHTGWFDGNGLTTAWRTRRVGNAALDDGWLTCLLYDVWTQTRVSVAFVDGPQGAIYSYRWDPGDHGDMKVNMIQTAHNGWGIDKEPMRDFDDCAKISRWGIRHSILWMRR